jgi:uncharacterized membrane protein YfcA
METFSTEHLDWWLALLVLISEILGLILGPELSMSLTFQSFQENADMA